MDVFQSSVTLDLSTKRWVHKNHWNSKLFIPGTQMTPVLIGKGLLFEGSNPKIEDKQVPGI